MRWEEQCGQYFTSRKEGDGVAQAKAFYDLLVMARIGLVSIDDS
jgi:hypothetical protein